MRISACAKRRIMPLIGINKGALRRQEIEGADMAIQERVSRLEGEQSGMSACLADLRSDMNFRFNIVFGLLIAIIGIGVAILVRI